MFVLRLGACWMVLPWLLILLDEPVSLLLRERRFGAVTIPFALPLTDDEEGTDVVEEDAAAHDTL